MFSVNAIIYSLKIDTEGNKGAKQGPYYQKRYEMKYFNYIIFLCQDAFKINWIRFQIVEKLRISAFGILIKSK